MSYGGAFEMDHFMSALWREAPFTQLPPDAPPEMQDYVEEIRDPGRNYAVHRARRRHDFQDLVSRFMIQLRKGCGDRHCDTSSCFTCRGRLAGTKPIRSYSPTSARILAVYMAGCENPYDNLCVGLRPSSPEPCPSMLGSTRLSSSPLPAVGKVKFATPSPLNDDPNQQATRKLRIQLHRKPDSSQTNHNAGNNSKQEPGTDESKASFTISEQPTSKDYRSFTAATFETTAFKMLQWLTPGGIRTLTDTLTGILRKEHGNSTESENDHQDTGVTEPAPPSSNSPGSLRHDRRTAGDSVTVEQLPTEKAKVDRFSPVDGSYLSQAERRRSTGSMIVSPIDNGTRLKFGRYQNPDDGQFTISAKDTTRLDRTKTRPFRDRPTCPRLSGLEHSHLKLRGSGLPPSIADDRSICESSRFQAKRGDNMLNRPISRGSQKIVQKHMQCPQTLRCLTPRLVEFLCDIYSEDCTAERESGFCSDAEDFDPVSWGTEAKLSRVVDTSGTTSHLLTWKAFNDQAIFSVLSDPHALISSFTIDDKLLDSHTMWYCMVRLTRATRALVLHSLWLAAEDLLKPPHDLQPVEPDHIIRGPRERLLSQTEASKLIAICFHALVAAVPVVSDSRTLYEMSRMRAGGQTLSNSPTSDLLSLEYDDVFSDDLALRLARRLFLAVAAGRRYADLRKRRGQNLPPGNRDSLLEALLTQIDFMNNAGCLFLEFKPADRLLHETRVPTLLLDWARAVLMSGWEGQPYFAEDSAFGGAMAFINALYQRRNSLLLGDVQFRADYFSERLDTVEIPVAWASPRSFSGVGHMLDYPFLFTSNTLVSFFRSINFARMSKTYEESSSLQTRMNAIVQPGSLITNPHHRFVLQDLLRTASARYLILDIGRKNVIRDAFDQLWRRESRELLRPLKVHLGEDGGEEGFDSGGVQQEFFRMAISECLNPVFGAFTVDDRTRMAWFVPGSVVETWRFELMGVLVSLALYNGLTLPVTFPRALYRKLLGAPVTELHHIADGWPDLVSGLTALLEWDESNGLVEDVFTRTYDFSVSAFGRYISRDMKQHHAAWPASVITASQNLSETAIEGPLVTNANKDEYVSDYIRYLTDVSIRPQFQAFERGFRRCLSPRSLKLLTPSILQSLVEGVQEIDVMELRMNTRYVGWDATHRTVKDFWSIVKKYDVDMRRRLLEFVTASDRVPVGGMRNMQFVIQKNGEEEGDKGRLPTAYTCYGTLLLPEYADKEILRERLGMALENAQGFGFA